MRCCEVLFVIIVFVASLRGCLRPFQTSWICCSCTVCSFTCLQPSVPSVTLNYCSQSWLLLFCRFSMIQAFRILVCVLTKNGWAQRRGYERKTHLPCCRAALLENGCEGIALYSAVSLLWARVETPLSAVSWWLWFYCSIWVFLFFTSKNKSISVMWACWSKKPD